MLVKFYGELREQCEDVELNVSNIQQAMAALKMIYGADITDQIMHNPYYYLVSTNEEPEKVIPMSEGLITMSFDDFDILRITPDIEGDWVQIVIAIVAIVLAAAVILLAPSPEFDSDPSEAQRKDSSLFKGPPNINEQGGSVPLNYGKSLAGGVSISAGLYAEDA